MRDIGNPELIQWDDSPPPDKTPYIPIVRASHLGRTEWQILSPDIYGVWMHSICRRDTPCLGTTCPHMMDGHHMGRTKKYYLAGWDFRRCRKVLIELTEDGVRTWHASNPLTRVEPQRGSYIAIWRVGKYEQAPMRYAFAPPPEVLDIEDPYDVHAALVRLWCGEDHPKPDSPA